MIPKLVDIKIFSYIDISISIVILQYNALILPWKYLIGWEEL